MVMGTRHRRKRTEEEAENGAGYRRDGRVEKKVAGHLEIEQALLVLCGFSCCLG